jgi:hypothetical protein
MKSTDESGKKRECLEMGNGGRSVEVVIRGEEYFERGTDQEEEGRLTNSS